ncbi:MAG: winged helix-turn-helix transcriptional regulator, partial [Myxococcota bacterium]
VSKNVLTTRLKRLVDEEILETQDAGQYGRRLEYLLTPKGKDLAIVLTALREWGDRWILGEGHEPLVVLDRRTGRRVPRLRIRDENGEPLHGRDMVIVPGPGADVSLLRRAEEDDPDRE